jgi:hypothetical protein
VSSPLTYLNTPDKGSDVVITGHEDGSVNVFRASDLSILYSFTPHLDCAGTYMYVYIYIYVYIYMYI